MTIADLLWRKRRGIRDDKEQRLQGKVAKSMSLTMMMMMMMTLAVYHVDGSDELFFIKRFTYSSVFKSYISILLAVL